MSSSSKFLIFSCFRNLISMYVIIDIQLLSRRTNSFDSSVNALESGEFSFQTLFLLSDENDIKY